MKVQRGVSLMYNFASRNSYFLCLVDHALRNSSWSQLETRSGASPGTNLLEVNARKGRESRALAEGLKTHTKLELRSASHQPHPTNAIDPSITHETFTCAPKLTLSSTAAEGGSWGFAVLRMGARARRLPCMFQDISRGLLPNPPHFLSIKSPLLLLLLR